MEIPRTASGKPMTQTVAFRLPIPEYQRAPELAQRRGLRLSEMMRQLVVDTLRDGSQAEIKESTNDG